MDAAVTLSQVGGILASSAKHGKYKADYHERGNEGGLAVWHCEASWQVVLRPVHNLWRLAAELTDVHAQDGCGLSLLGVMQRKSLLQECERGWEGDISTNHGRAVGRSPCSP